MVELGHETITSELVAKERGEILEAMYERSFEGLAEPVRLFVEDRLLTASGFRGTLPLSEALAEGVSPLDLEILVDRRLLRFEDRLGTRHVELSHDLLTGVVKKSRGFRAARVAREEEERKQQELRHALARARRRTAVAAATAMLALAGVAYSVYYWLAYIHPTSAYYRTFSNQLGRIVPYGKINIQTVHHRRISFEVTRKGFSGEILSLEAVDRNAKPTMQNGLSTLLNSDRPSGDQGQKRKDSIRDGLGPESSHGLGLRVSSLAGARELAADDECYLFRTRRSAQAAASRKRSRDYPDPTWR
jgi:hypothetical protein